MAPGAEGLLRLEGDLAKRDLVTDVTLKGLEFRRNDIRDVGSRKEPGAASKKQDGCSRSSRAGCRRIVSPCSNQIIV